MGQEYNFEFHRLVQPFEMQKWKALSGLEFPLGLVHLKNLRAILAAFMEMPLVFKNALISLKFFSMGG